MMVLTAAEKQKRYRAKKSNGKVTESVTKSNGNDPVTLNPREIEQGDKIGDNESIMSCGNGQDGTGVSRPAIPRTPCTCRHCANVKANGSRHTLNHGPHKDANTLAKDELNRVALPGDQDYKGVA